MPFLPLFSRSFSECLYKEIFIISVDNGKVISRLVGHENTVMQIVFNENGEELLSGSTDGTARIWEIATGQELSRFSSIEVTPDQ